MKVVKVEQTPNPNAVRVKLDTELPTGESYNYKKADAATASEPMASLLNVNGVQGIYHVMDFMAVEKSGDVEWDDIIADIESIMSKV